MFSQYLETKNVLEIQEQSSQNANLQDIQTFSLIETIKQNKEIEFFKLLNLKIDNFGKKFIDEFDAKHKGSFVYWAAALGYAHFIPHLVKAGVDANKPDKNGITPVFIAAQEGHAPAITALLEAGADASARVMTSWCWGTTALNKVKQSKNPKHREVIQVLESHFKQYPNGINPATPKTCCPYFSKTVAISLSAFAAGIALETGRRYYSKF